MYIYHYITVTMRLVKLPQEFDLSAVGIPSLKPLRKHNSLFPAVIRAIVCGPSNCGKTHLMTKLLLHKNGLLFQNVILFSNTFSQCLYLSTSSIINSIPGMNFQHVSIEKLNGGYDVPPYSVAIFDDISKEYYEILKELFCYGRHKHIDIFLLIQSYILAPKHFCRDNANTLIIFKTDAINLRHIYDEHASGDMPLATFTAMCNKAWKEPHGFLCIFKDDSSECGRYRIGFDTYFENINKNANKRWSQ